MRHSNINFKDCSTETLAHPPISHDMVRFGQTVEGKGILIDLQKDIQSVKECPSDLILHFS